MKLKLKPRHTKTIQLTPSAGRWALPEIQVGTLRPKKILVPVDFTDCSHKAVTYAVSLAKHFHSEVILLHVAQLTTPAPAAELVPLQTNLLDQQLREDDALQLSQWRDRVAVHVRTRAVVSSGVSVHDEIVETARRNNCDLIVIATQPKGAIEHLFTGSVAEKVVHHAPCPVFVVREREHDFIQTRRRRRPSLATTAK